MSYGAPLPPASPLMRHASPGIPHQAPTAQSGPIQPGSITYTTTVGPDGSVTYHPFRAVPASYQTAQGVVHGIQWVPAEATSVLPAGATPASEEILASFNRPATSSASDWRNDGRRSSVVDDPYRRGYDKDTHDGYGRRGDRDRDRDYRRDDRDYYRDRDDRDHRRDDTYRRERDGKEYDRDRAYRPDDDYRRDHYEREREEELRARDRDERDRQRQRGGDYYGDRKYTSPAADLERRFQDLDIERRERDPYDPRDGRDREVNAKSHRNSTYGDRATDGGYPTYTSPRVPADTALRRPVSPYREPPAAPRPVSSYQAGGVVPRPVSPYQAAPVAPRPVSPYQSGGVIPRPVSPYRSAPAAVTAPRPVSPYRPPTTTTNTAPRPVSPYRPPPNSQRVASPYHGGGPPRPISPYHGPTSMPRPTSPYTGASRSGPAPRAGYASAPGGSPVTYTTSGPANYDTEEKMLATPEGFLRPPNLAQSYSPFDIIKIQDMDDFFENIPRMPLVLVTHDVYHEDWIRLMTDLALAWSGKLPVPEYGQDGSRPKRTMLLADLVDLWNASFFVKRGAELVLYKGRERRSGRNVGAIDAHLPGFDDYADPPEEDDDLSDDSDYDSARYGYGAQGGVYGRGVDREMAELHEARRQRHEKKKVEHKRRRQERRHRQRVREAERKYSLYLTCVSPRDAGIA